MRLLFFYCITEIALRILSQETTEPCMNTEAFSIGTLGIGGEAGWIRTINGCLMNDLVGYVHVLSPMESLEENTFVNLIQLRGLYMRGNGLRQIKPGFIKNIPGRFSIDFSDNRIASLKSGVFKGLNLLSLNLKSNEIYSLDALTFEDLDSLELVLTDNKLAEVSSDWFRNSRIRMLNLSYNEITILSEKTFTGLIGLETIDLSHNKIQFVTDRTFSALIFVKSLSLRGNLLSAIDFLDSTTINFLDVSFNMMNSMNMKESMNVSEIVIYPNPWNCKCLFKFWRYAWKHGILYNGRWIYNSAQQEELKKLPVCIDGGNCDNPELQQKYFKMVDYSLFNESEKL